jgi:sporulenol synthase
MIGELEPASIRQAICRGTRTLLDELAQQPDCLWRDFRRADGSGGSNVWVSGFIAAHLGRSPAARPAAASAIARLIAGRRAEGGWGYDEQLLPDADSTAWVLLAARATGSALPRSVLLAAIRFLLRHQDGSGGFATYGSEGVPLFAGTTGREGWFAPQPCVTAAALAALTAYASPDLPAIAAAAAYLERAAVDDLWHAYWWYGPTYATYLAVRALATAGGGLTPARSSAITAALLRRRNGDGGWDGKHLGRSLAFPTALGLLTLLELGASAAVVAPSAALLLSRQQADGEFEASAELLVPGGTSAGPMTMVDQGWFTTACVLSALHAYLGSLPASADADLRAPLAPASGCAWLSAGRVKGST